MKDHYLFPILNLGGSLYTVMKNFIPNQINYCMKHPDSSSQLDSTSHLYDSGTIIMDELFKNWVDELIPQRTLQTLLNKLFFTTTPEDQTLQELDICLAKYLSPDNQEMKSTVLDIIQGMKKTVEHYQVKNFLELVLMLKSEKDYFLKVIEHQSEQLEYYNIQNKSN